MATGITLCLGGGAARGFTHIGAIRALVENDIRVQQIVGISMGSICGAIYSVMPDVDFLDKRMRQLINFEAFKSSVVGSWDLDSEGATTRNIVRKAQKMWMNTNILRRIFTASGVLTTTEVHAVLNPFIADIRIRATEIPFATAAVNIRSGALRIFRGDDSLRPAVTASASMPIIFPPERVDNDWFVDGGVLDKLGIEAARRLGAEKLVVVDVSDEKLADNLPRSGFDVMLKTEEIASEHRRNVQLSHADLVLKPIRGTYHWADYSAVENFIQMGYDDVQDHIGEIRRIASGRKLFRVLNKFF